MRSLPLPSCLLRGEWGLHERPAVFFDLGGDCDWRLCDRFSGLTILLLTVQTLGGAESSVLDSDSVEEEL